MAKPFRELKRELLRNSQFLDRNSICSTCLYTLRRPHQTRHASTATASATEDPSLSNNASVLNNTSFPSPTPLTNSPQNPYHIKAGIVLSRAPLITRDLTPFEKAFFFYQRRLDERLALSFPQYFYFPKGTPGDTDWKRKMRERRTPARDIGDYSAYDKDAWNDEILMGSTDSEPDTHVEALLQDAVIEVEEQIEGQEGVVKRRIEVERPMPRETDADREGDTKSLTRALQRTLYLVVKGKDGIWKFPDVELEERESLKRAAERLLVEAGGIDMNTWIVGNAPVGHFTRRYEDASQAQAKVQSDTSSEAQSTPTTMINSNNPDILGEKTFFMKGRIMAGQFRLQNRSGSRLGLHGFQWLARDELEKIFDPLYFKQVRGMLVKQ